MEARRSCWTVACTWATRTHAGDAAATTAPAEKAFAGAAAVPSIHATTNSSSIVASSFAPWHGCHMCGLTLPTARVPFLSTPAPLPVTHPHVRFPDFSLLGPPDPDYTSVIDAVLISHFHMDHVGALPYFTEVPWGMDKLQLRPDMSCP